jgi:glycosyltransferase involved in cell wall biosynthesis
MRSKPIILHICKDYPDAIQSADKTKAVSNLVENTKDFDHIVFSLNRTSSLAKRFVIRGNPLFAINYWGLPGGIGLKSGMAKTAKRIEEIICQEGLSFDLVHAHKLTMEGIVGYHISRRFQKPMACTIRGQTDFEVIRYKPHYRKFFAEILRHARWLFFLAPWTQKEIGNTFPGITEHKSSMLPNIVYYAGSEKRPKPILSNRLITAVRFDAKNFKSKYLGTTIAAFDRACRIIGDIHLDIAGGGISPNRDKTKRLLDSVPSAANIHLTGNMENARFCEILPDYAAFVRPSYPETFGMVYLEALLAGIPVLHTKNTGIDGYFPNAAFAVAVDYRSAEAIAEGIIDLYKNQKELKSCLQKSLDSGDFSLFMKESIVHSYIARIEDVLKKLKTRSRKLNEN